MRVKHTTVFEDDNSFQIFCLTIKVYTIILGFIDAILLSFEQMLAVVESVGSLDAQKSSVV